jgi:hypothetical protein
MTTGNTTLLGLALPVDGELDGTWGDVVNDSITSLVDSAVAGTTTLSTDADVTLTTTALAANQARQAVLLWTASNGATTRNVTAPAQSKPYIVINAGTGSIVLRGAGPTTGITIIAGERCVAAWSGSDFVKVASTVVSNLTGTLPIANGGTGATDASGARTNFGATTLGANLFTIANPSAVTFPRFNADNTVSSLNAADFRTAIGAGTGAGDVVGPASATNNNLAAFDGTTGKLIKQAATVTVAQGGTGQTTANAAFNALVPSQTSNSGKVLTTDGTNTSWSFSVDGIVITRGANSPVGDSTVSIGSSLSANTTGFDNTAVGKDALTSNTEGYQNTAVGFYALRLNTTGAGNIAVGTYALQPNTTGTANTAVGVSALASNTTGLYNTGTGYAAGAAISTGSNNTALGTLSLQSLTTGSDNIAVGYTAASGITTGSNNTIIGDFSGSASLAGVVAINAGTTNRVYIDASGNVGFGTTSPSAAIDHTGSTLRLRTSRTPASASATGAAGEVCWDSNYVYVCVATNTWKRSALSTW